MWKTEHFLKDCCILLLSLFSVNSVLPTRLKDAVVFKRPIFFPFLNWLQVNSDKKIINKKTCNITCRPRRGQRTSIFRGRYTLIRAYQSDGLINKIYEHFIFVYVLFVSSCEGNLLLWLPLYLQSKLWGLVNECEEIENAFTEVGDSQELYIKYNLMFWYFSLDLVCSKVLKRMWPGCMLGIRLITSVDWVSFV